MLCFETIPWIVLREISTQNTFLRDMTTFFSFFKNIKFLQKCVLMALLIIFRSDVMLKSQFLAIKNKVHTQKCVILTFDGSPGVTKVKKVKF